MKGQQLEGMKLGNELTKAQTNKTNVEAKVATKGIPEAELKNKFYEKVSPLIDKVFGPQKTTAPKHTPYIEKKHQEFYEKYSTEAQEKRKKQEQQTQSFMRMK